MEAATVLASAEDRVVDEAVAVLAQHDHAHRQPVRFEDRRRNVRQLFGLILHCLHKGQAEPVIKPSEQLAAHGFAAGVDVTEIQAEFNALAGVLWRHVADGRADEQQIRTLELVNAAIEAGKDALARTYVTLASQEGAQVGEQPARPEEPATSGTGPDDPAETVVWTDIVDQIGVITLDDQPKRNAVGTRMANGVVAGLGRLRARGARVVVLRAAPGMTVWSAGHDIDELPRGRRDPLGYDDPLENLLRAVRTFPAPVIAMVHGTVWGGALDLVFSCDLVVADETAAFAITSVNLGLPYNITGLLHFMGRLPVNLIKEMFFTAAPVDARTAKEWQIVNHLVAGDRLESFTKELAATIATKSPLAIAVIKEQLRVLSDYQPIAAQVYERVQGLRRRAYDSSDYLEGLAAFAEKRQPVFRGC